MIRFGVNNSEYLGKHSMRKLIKPQVFIMSPSLCITWKLKIFLVFFNSTFNRCVVDFVKTSWGQQLYITYKNWISSIFALLITVMKHKCIKGTLYATLIWTSAVILSSLIKISCAIHCQNPLNHPALFTIQGNRQSEAAEIVQLVISKTANIV